MKVARIVISTVALVVVSAPILAQNRPPIPRDEMSKYVISARAGVVNLVEGDAKVLRARPFAIPEMLISGDELQNRDTLKTGTNGRAEILLNPGCYLRLGEQSAFVFLFDDFISDKIKLLQGSAVLEASAIDGSILVETPKANFEITRDGLYRFNVGADGKAEVAVRKGRVFAGDTTIREGKRAVVEGGTAAIAKLNKQDVDALDDWSKGRAKSLIAANSRLSNAGMWRTVGISFLRNSWIYDPFCRCYTFLPLSGGFASPYGWDYSVCNPYGYYYYYSGRRYNNGGWTGGGANGGGHTSGGGSSSGGGRSGGGGNSGGGAGHPSNPPPAPPDPGRGASSGQRDREAPAHRRP